MSSSEIHNSKAKYNHIRTPEVGQHKQDQSMVHRGMELYGTSLARLACELKTPSKITHTELAATCRLLALYEVCFEILIKIDVEIYCVIGWRELEHVPELASTY